MIQFFSSSTDGADSEDLDEKTGSHSDGDEIAEMGVYEADIGIIAKVKINLTYLIYLPYKSNSI